MREIKFRAWDTITNTMLNWEELSSQQNNLDLATLNVSRYEDSNLKFMQYTGLKDKNGVEIFEGDIVQHHDHLEAVYGIVSWDEEEAAFTPGVGLMSENKSWLEVIGNIYENPELLEAEPLKISERNE